MPKKRADILLVEHGLAESRSMAQRLVMAGQVRVKGELVAKPSMMVADDSLMEVIDLPKYVSRGGLKLESALLEFAIDVNGMVCADVGASTGGFSDCLLQNGANKVYAIDVGRDQLHWKLRSDNRLVVMEKTNARYLDALPELVDLVTIDASFISLEMLLPQAMNWLHQHGNIIALVKPQFEVGKAAAERSKGVIRSVDLHREVLNKILEFAISIGAFPAALIPSPIKGPKGNIEFLLLISTQLEMEKMGSELVNSALESAQALR